MNRRSLSIVALAIYVTLMLAMVWGLFQARSWAATTFQPAEARAEWQDFRDDVAQGRAKSTVIRDVPQSVEPPALVLMRDYFPACAGISLLLSSALYATLAAFVIGTLTEPSRSDRATEDA